MIVQASPLGKDAGESLCSLNFASRARSTTLPLPPSLSLPSFPPSSSPVLSLALLARLALRNSASGLCGLLSQSVAVWGGGGGVGDARARARAGKWSWGRRRSTPPQVAPAPPRPSGELSLLPSSEPSPRPSSEPSPRPSGEPSAPAGSAASRVA
eukprot:2446497-Rhodomonas_salina.1